MIHAWNRSGAAGCSSGDGEVFAALENALASAPREADRMLKALDRMLCIASRYDMLLAERHDRPGVSSDASGWDGSRKTK